VVDPPKASLKSDSTLADAPGFTALPSVLARVLAFSSVILASFCGGLLGFSLGRMQWGDRQTFWVFIAGATGSTMAAVGVAVVCVLVLRAMSEWADTASVKARRR